MVTPFLLQIGFSQTEIGAIQGAMFILAGLVEGAGIIALVLCLALVFI